MAFNKVLDTFLRFLDHVDMMVLYRLHTHNDLLFSHRPKVGLGSGDYSEYSELIIMLCDVVQYDQGMDLVSRLAKILFGFFYDARLEQRGPKCAKPLYLF